MSGKIKISKGNLDYKLRDLKILMTEKWQVVLLVSMFWAGLIIGSFYINHADGAIFEKIKIIVQNSYNSRETYTGVQIFENAMCKYGIFLFLSFFFGLSGVGYPIIILVPCLCGISSGLFSGYIYSNFGFSGALYSISTVYPGLIIATVALIIGSCESMDMSQNILRIILDKNRIANESTVKKYAYQYAILLGITIISALLEMILCNLFLSKFSLF